MYIRFIHNQTYIYIHVYIYIYASPPKTHILTPWQMFLCHSIVFHVDAGELLQGVLPEVCVHW